MCSLRPLPLPPPAPATPSLLSRVASLTSLALPRSTPPPKTLTPRPPKMASPPPPQSKLPLHPDRSRHGSSGPTWKA
ncbi:hypothetical protein Zm00014a_039799 [Zea mays]|uniref:Uncharacterized protein n=1 Tax=Zea mays TaxID=4577 RepID=A0A3L6ESE4_MAIZE|nr:hypothetical protein Zm00014a_039799 [Zea mays]